MKQNNNDTKSFSGKIIPENIGKEVKKMTRRERYLYEREKGRIVVFDERYIGSSELVEDIINGRNLMTALRKALQLLNENEYQIIYEIFFESNRKPNYTRLAQRHNISRQCYCRKVSRILLKLRQLIADFYIEF